MHPSEPTANTPMPGPLPEAAELVARVYADASDPILLLDGHGRVIDCNPAAILRYGWSPDDIRGRFLWDTVPADRAEATRSLLDRCRAGQPVRNHEQTRVGATDTAHVLVTLSPLFAGGALVGFAALDKDLAELHAIESALSDREELVRQLEQKNAELERFTYTVSHDLKSPLITIRGFLGRLERDLDLGSLDRARDRIVRIARAADRMDEQLADLLELSRVGRIVNASEAVPLGEVVQEARELLYGRLVEVGAHIEVDDLPSVHGDRVRLREVVQNLIENAITHRQPGLRPLIEIGATTRGRFVECWVRDNGRGIEPAYHDRVFRLFERLDPEGPGTGIGLTLVKRIVEVHGGTITVESRGPGEGTTFRFTLPVPP